MDENITDHNEDRDEEGESNEGAGNALYSRLLYAPSELYNWLKAVTRPIREPYEVEAINEEHPHGSVITRKSARHSMIPTKTSLELNSTLELLAETEEIRLIDELPSTIPSDERVLNKHIISILQAAMPARYRICQDWKLIYSSRRDGYSLSTLFQLNRKYQDCPCILAVKDDKGTIFGAWTTESFHVQNGHYGTGECFLWKATGKEKRMIIEKHGATGKNPYYLMSEASYLAAGVSEGVFGLWLEERMGRGSSRPVITYDNPCLASGEEFDVEQVEVWALVKGKLF